MEMDVRQLGCAEPSFAREVFVLPQCLGSSHLSFIQQLLLPAMSQLSSSVTVTPDGSSGLRIQLWVKTPVNVSLCPSFFEDSFPLYFPSLGLNQLPYRPSK